MAAKSKKQLPDELIASRPCLEGDPSETHPSMGLPPGRPPVKYTPAVHEKICERVRAGDRPVVAASLAGITASTFHSWIQKGREGDPHLAQFAEDVEIAFNEAESIALGVVTAGFNSPDPDKRSSEDAKWFLERARSAGYSKAVKTVIEGQIQEFMQRLETALDPATFHRVLAVYMGFDRGESAPKKELTVGGEEE